MRHEIIKGWFTKLIQARQKGIYIFTYFSFIYSFIRLFIYSIIHSINHSFIHSFIHYLRWHWSFGMHCRSESLTYPSIHRHPDLQNNLHRNRKSLLCTLSQVSWQLAPHRSHSSFVGHFLTTSRSPGKGR